MAYGPFEFLRRFIGGVILGPAFSGLSLMRGFCEGLSVLFEFNKSTVLAYFLIIFTIILLYKKEILPQWLRNLFQWECASSSKVLQINILWRSFNYHKDVSPALYLCIISVIMIPLSYLMSFTHYPPTAILGRGTSVHLMASVSWAFFISSAFSLLSSHFGTRKIIFICVIMLLSFMRYSTMIQYSFVDISNEEKKVFARL
jgi:hypothetical protein